MLYITFIKENWKNRLILVQYDGQAIGNVAANKLIKESAKNYQTFPSFTQIL